ncbi:MAG TPA: 3D domain-containing protein [Kofleriaceae bacterium]|nr:3D domain-containing protein [Kofleriaceae bacterium]
MRWLIALGLLAGCGGDDDGGGGGGGGTPDGGGSDAAPDHPDARTGEPGPSLGTFELTYYWVAYEGDYRGPADSELLDADCAVLATVSSDFADAIALEGTGRLLDGRLLNVAGACDCASSPCYLEADADHPWGYGVQDRALVPFRSVAVDRDVIEYGTGLYLPALDGRTMPGDAPWGDFSHDGCAVAADTGGGIVGMHVDFFVGIRAAYVALDGELGLSETEVRDGGERCPDEPSG